MNPRGPTGMAARSPPRVRRPAAAPTSCGSPARPISTACSPPRSSATSPRCPSRSTFRPRPKSTPRARTRGSRALELIRLGMRNEGVREWLFGIRYFDDARLLAASEFARRAEIWDRSIQAADRTVRSHNFALRYPLPYREVFTEYAKTYDLDEAWVLGLVRQESRFITDARSAAGAAGLMQVMPRTARFVAHKIGLRNYQRKGVTEIETNVTLGAGYLRLVLDQLGHQVLASAAYNAGPARARRWRDAS